MHATPDVSLSAKQIGTEMDRLSRCVLPSTLHTCGSTLPWLMLSFSMNLCVKVSNNLTLEIFAIF